MPRHRMKTTMIKTFSWMACLCAFLPLKAMAQSAFITAAMPECEVVSSNRYLIDGMSNSYREVVVLLTPDSERLRITSEIDETGPKSGMGSSAPLVQHAENVFVELYENANHEQFVSALVAHGGRIVKGNEQWKLYAITFDNISLSENKVELSLEAAALLPGVERVLPYGFGYSMANPADGLYPYQWYLKNTGQYGGTPGADINAEEGWSKQSHASNIVVAVIDTGVYSGHYDLQNVMWVNPGEQANTGIDHDGNGYTNDLYGFDFVRKVGSPNTNYGYHGTAVAGVIGAEANNTVGWHGGVVGVAWGAKIMDLNVCTVPPSIDGWATIEAVYYAISNGAHIINCSFGFLGPVPAAFSNAFVAANNAGILVVAAAGNYGINLDQNPNWREAPARLPYNNIISVMASDPNDNRCIWSTNANDSSNYGQTWTDLAAPGVLINNTFTNGPASYAGFNGTSFSAPIVSGALALMKEKFPNLSYNQLIERLLSTVDPIPSLSNLTATGGRLNLDNAVNHIFDGAYRWADGWCWNSWFLMFRDEYYPWVYHNEHRWLYTESIYKSDMWFYDPNTQIGWFWTTDTVYPNIWSSAQNSWLSYQPNSCNPRWFYKHSTSNWFSVVDSGSLSDGPPPIPLN